MSQLWPQFNADETFARCFAGVLVEQVELLRISRKLKISLRSASPLPIELCGRLCASLAPQFEGLELMVCNYFPFETITEESLRAMIDELRSEGLPVNGFLDHASFALQGTQLTITVPVGKNILDGIGFGDTLAKLVEQRTGVLPTVTLEQNSSVSADEWEKRVMQKAPAPRFEEKKQPPDFKIPGLDLTDKPVSVFHGKNFKPNNVTPLKDLGSDSGKVTIWGDVFAAEVKGNFQKSYIVSITDYTGSISLKLRSRDGEDYSKWEEVKKGTTLVLKGECAYDKYEHDYVV